MSVDTLLAEYQKTDIVPDRPVSADKVNRAEQVFDTSIRSNISFVMTDAEVLAGEVLGYVKELEESPLYQDMDKLIDVFDPSEPPEIRDGIADPMGDLLKAELIAARGVVKWGSRALSWIYSPIDRGWKFLTNALMYDPLTKSMVGPIRRQILIDFENAKVLKRLKPEREKLRIELLKKHKEDKETFLKEYNERHTKLEEQIRQQVKKDMSGIIKVEEEEITELPPVTAGDFAESGLNALKALVPWPGFADDVKGAGDIAAGSFERIVGREKRLGIMRRLQILPLKLLLWQDY